MAKKPTYQPDAYYRVRFAVRFELMRTAMYPGRDYEVRGDVLVEHADKVESAEKIADAGE